METVSFKTAHVRAAFQLVERKPRTEKAWSSYILCEVIGTERVVVATDGAILLACYENRNGDTNTEASSFLIEARPTLQTALTLNSSCPFFSIADGGDGRLTLNKELAYKAPTHIPFPNWRATLPTSTPTMERGHFDPVLLGRLYKSVQIAAGEVKRKGDHSSYVPPLLTNGPQSAAIVSDPGLGILGLIMPRRLTHDPLEAGKDVLGLARKIINTAPKEEEVKAA